MYQFYYEEMLEIRKNPISIISVLEELIRQMTAYRFDDDDVESEEVDIALEDREIQSDQATETKDSVEIKEIIEPKLTAVKEEKAIVINEIEAKTVFKTKCQLMQEEIENGEKVQSGFFRFYNLSLKFLLHPDIKDATFVSINVNFNVHVVRRHKVEIQN